MKSGTAIGIIMASVLAFTSLSSFAQQGPGGGAGADRAQRLDRNRTYDRDRMSVRDRTQDRTRIEVQEQDKDWSRIQDPANISDHDIYGSELMTTTERNRYRRELSNSETQASREEFQIRHEAKMQERALLKDQDLVPPGQGPIFGGELMSVQERNEYREQLRVLGTDQDREQFQAQHRYRINERADALGLEVD